MGPSETIPGTKRSDEILTVAAKLFAEQGYHGTSMRQIAESSLIQPGTLYNHFEGKEQLFLRVGDRYFDAVIPPLLAASNLPASVPARLAAMISVGIQVGQAHPNERAAVTNDLKFIARTNDLHRLMEKRDLCIAMWNRVLAEGVSDRTLRSDIPAEASLWIIFASIVGVVDNSYSISPGTPPPTDALAIVVLEGLRPR